MLHKSMTLKKAEESKEELKSNEESATPEEVLAAQQAEYAQYSSEAHSAYDRIVPEDEEDELFGAAQH